MSFGSLPSVLGNGGGVAISVIGGTGLFADGTAAAPSISFAADTDTGFYRDTSNLVGFSAGGASSLRFGSAGTIYGASNANYVRLNNSGGVELAAAGTAQNITLTPSTTGQVSHIGLSNFSDTLFFGNSSGSYGRITWGSALTFQAGAGLPFTLVSSNGTEVARGFANGRFGIGTGATDSGALLQVGTDLTTAANGMIFGTDTRLYRNGVNGLIFNGTGTGDTGFNIAKSGTIGLGLLYDGANAYLTATAGMLLRTNGGNTALTLGADLNATFAGTISGTNITASSGAYYAWTSKTRIKSPSDGVVTLLNAAETDFSRLQFGGTTASFPALKRTGAQFDILLADESDFTTVRLANVRAVRAAATASAGEIAYGGTTATTVGAAGGASALPATPTGYIIVNVAGTQMKVPYYAN